VDLPRRRSTADPADSPPLRYIPTPFG